MGITESDFNVVAGHLGDTLNKFSVPEREQQELFTIIDSLKPTWSIDIVDGALKASNLLVSDHLKSPNPVEGNINGENKMLSHHRRYLAGLLVLAAGFVTAATLWAQSGGGNEAPKPQFNEMGIHLTQVF